MMINVEIGEIDIDATPNEELPLRILLACRDCLSRKFLVSTTGYWDGDKDVIENEERLRIIDKAIKKLGGGKQQFRIGYDMNLARGFHLAVLAHGGKED